MASGIEAVLQNLWTAMPGIVQSYDAAKQRVNVQVAVKTTSVGEDGELRQEVVGVLNAVPVVHLGGSGFRSYFPPARGDTCLLVICSRSIDTFLNQGGVVDSFFLHRHDLSDAVALVGLRDFAHPLKNAPTDHASIGHDEGATIEFRQTKIKVGGDTGTQPTVMANSFFTAFSTLITAIAAAMAASGAPNATASGTAITTALSTFNTSLATYLTTVTEVK